MQQDIDTLWIVMAAILVFLMQSGFTSYETGLIRAKNALNVAFKNISDFVIAILAFWSVGFALMFGSSVDGWFGQGALMLQDIHSPREYAFFIFQLMFAGTAATIVSGAVAERMKFKGYLITSLMITALIYPVSGHWVWGGALHPDQMGWLEQLGFIDFAGSTVVHSVGGWLGLVGAWVLGPRIGRFDSQGHPQRIPPHNLATSTLGVFVLWFGWFGFNGGSTMMVGGEIAGIMLNTLLSPAASAATCMVISVVLNRGQQIEIDKILNGVIAGLVGITAGCAIVEPIGAVLIGISSALVLYVAEWVLLYRMRIDDPVSAIAAHGVVGSWGTLAVAVVAPTELLPLQDSVAQFQVQLVGVGAILGWTLMSGLLLFGVLKRLGALRVSEEEELQGLNVAEHGATTTWHETMRSMHDIVERGDLSTKVAVEPGTEAGEMARSFNALLSQVNQTFDGIHQQIHKAMEEGGAEITDPSQQKSNLGGMRRWMEQKTSALVEMNRSLKREARHDGLTGLPNRQLLMERIKRGISRCQRGRERLGVIFIDLDNFKRVNDELGHQQGDELLQEVGHILQQSIRDDDTAARLGGDEFVVLMHGWWKRDEVRQLAERILQQLRRSYDGPQGEIVVSGSAGIALYPEDGGDAERLMEQADQAMYRAKKAGKGQASF